MSRFDFELASLPPEAFSYQHMMSRGMSKAEAKAQVQRMKEQTVYLSDTYQVNVETVFVQSFGFAMKWLSIKRRDKAAFHDWRELQGIKNAICGPEHEAVELYPAESRLVDTANQYHLWVLPEGHSFPFGYREREVIGPEEAAQHGAVQRAFC